ncbi:MAG: ATP-binding cassette domain-containing protein, partial [Firmicutes bacterium]|nr:ATP-binding cassette domain-containing protein [Bacillota bacterium]
SGPLRQIQAVQLRVQSLTVLDDAGLPAVRGLDFELRQGEILGFAGVTGNGQRELAEALTGLRPVSAGRVILLGRDVTGFSRNQLRRSGVGYVPEDRTHMGLCLDWKVQDNLIAGFHREPPVSHGILKTLDHRAVRGLADRLVPEFDIRCPSPVTTARTLSGGNQQKVVVAREVSRQPEVLVACEPTRGVDVGAIQFIHNRLLTLRNQGKGVVLISSDLDEVVSLSDRVAVLFRGRIMGIVDPASTTREELGLLMAGITGRKAGD